MNRVRHIEAVTVCVGYADFLQETAPWNIPLFEKWLIVTHPSDHQTREVCRRFNLDILLSDDGRRHSDHKFKVKKGGMVREEEEGFNKGRMLERGLQHTSATGWRIQLDADMALPHRFRHSLEIADLQEDTIYGIDRVMVRSYDQWKKLIGTGYLQGGQYDYHCRTAWPNGLDIGTRWSHPQMGYCPVGFFQMWHSSQDEWRGIRIKPYPMNHGNACRTDIQHSLQWDRHKRALIPEVMGVHLESEKAERGANWNGRTTKQFGPGVKKGPTKIGSC